MKKNFLLFLILLTPALSCVWAQPQTEAPAPGAPLTLSMCHRLALQENKQLKSTYEQKLAAEELKKMSLAEFFPRASANGVHHWQQKNLQILSDEQQSTLNNMGTNIMNHAITGSNLSSLLNSLLGSQTNQVIQTALQGITTPIANNINAVGQSIVDALDMDLNNLTVGMVTVTQPVYLGGKLRAAYKTASMVYNIADLQFSKQQQDKLVEVDNAYWQVVSVKHKKELAEQYCRLLEHLDSNMQLMVTEEVATRGDATKVRVKLNEAQMMLTKATSGYDLARMLLFQTVGLDLYGGYDVIEDTVLVNYRKLDNINMLYVMEHRDELKLLSYADTIAQAGVMMARSALLPNVVVTGSYLTTKPSFFNGYEKAFGGTLAAGVAVNIPIAHAGAIYSYRAAKHQAAAIRYQKEEAQEKISLQVNKLNTDLDVSCRKLVQAQSNLENAEENLRLANESFEAGVISTTELMGAQTAWLQAKSEVIDADIEIRMNHLYLEQALGKRRIID